MSSPVDIEQWRSLASQLGIRLPEEFLNILSGWSGVETAWKFLSAAEALSLKAELDLRFDYHGREWRGIPFASSLVCEDVVCFDLTTPPGEESKVLPIRDWHGPRWEFSGDVKTFEQWLTQDSGGNLT